MSSRYIFCLLYFLTRTYFSIIFVLAFHHIYGINRSSRWKNSEKYENVDQCFKKYTKDDIVNKKYQLSGIFRFYWTFWAYVHFFFLTFYKK